MDYSLFQEHTVRLYDLKNHPFKVQKVKARSLLSVYRFDLFAKLYYARFREKRPELAKTVYLEHIRAFNPDGKEPGRPDKTSFEDFLQTYDDLLDYFKENDFDDTKSIVPLSSDGIILDGGHRVAALSFYDKEITVAVFDNVYPVGQFDYIYFKQRGLPQNIRDIIAFEIFNWIPDCFVACMWPRMDSGIKKDQAIDVLNSLSQPFYRKSFDVNLSSLTSFIANVYKDQSWVGTAVNNFAGAKDKALNCYMKGNRLDLFFFTSTAPIEEILRKKEQIRSLFPYGKHSIHITDNNAETQDIAFYALSPSGIDQWLYVGNWKGWKQFQESVAECFYIFRHTYWIDFKVKVASLLFKLKG